MKYKDKIKVLDSDSSTFDKKHFPNNYISHIKQNIGLADIIFISSHETVRDKLNDENIPYIIYYPSKDRKDEFMMLYRNRGNNDTFLKILDDNFNNFIDSIEYKTNKNVTKIKLQNESEFIGNNVFFNDLIYKILKENE